MTTVDINKQVAINLGYWDYTGADFQTGKDVTEAIILSATNYIYRERIFPEVVKIFPEFYKTISKASNYENNSTVSTNVTTTLVSVDAIFTTGSVGCKVYNSTTEETAYIDAYTNTTTVTLDDSYGWTAADVIYLFSGVYGFGGDATDIYLYPGFVGIKYNSTDVDYTKCVLEGSAKTNYYGVGRNIQTNTETNPIYNITTITSGTTPTSAVVINPIPEYPITDGFYMEYEQIPTALSADGDVPRIPLGYESMIANGATAFIADSILNDTMKAAKFEKRFQEALGSLIGSSQSFDEKTEDGQIESRISKFRDRSY